MRLPFSFAGGLALSAAFVLATGPPALAFPAAFATDLDAGALGRPPPAARHAAGRPKLSAKAPRGRPVHVARVIAHAEPSAETPSSRIDRGAGFAETRPNGLSTGMVHYDYGPRGLDDDVGVIGFTHRF